MMYGSISTRRELIIPIRLLDTNGHIHRYEAIGDTGFTGHLTFPSEHTRELGLVTDQPVDALVANEETFRFNSYRGIVLWQGERLSIRIIETEGTPLIGIGLLWGSLLTAEITDDGAVTISPLPVETSG